VPLIKQTLNSHFSLCAIALLRVCKTPFESRLFAPARGITMYSSPLSAHTLSVPDHSGLTLTSSCSLLSADMSALACNGMNVNDTSQAQMFLLTMNTCCKLMLTYRPGCLQRPTPEEQTLAQSTNTSSHNTNQPRLAKNAVVHTTLGDIHIRLFPNKAPKAVENSVGHASGYFEEYCSIVLSPSMWSLYLSFISLRWNGADLVRS
jgi:hypothetical protein